MRVQKAALWTLRTNRCALQRKSLRLIINGMARASLTIWIFAGCRTWCNVAPMWPPFGSMQLPAVRQKLISR